MKHESSYSNQEANNGQSATPRKSSKRKIITLLIAAGLASACEQHFPNDKFIWGIGDRSGKSNITYDISDGSDELIHVYIDVDVRENGDEGYIAYITKGKGQPYQISAKTIEELKSKLEYEIVTKYDDKIYRNTQVKAKEKIISFSDAYDMFLKDSEDEYIEMNNIEARLKEIMGELDNLKGDKGEDTKLIRERLQDEKKSLEKRLKELKKPIEVPYNKQPDSTGN